MTSYVSSILGFLPIAPIACLNVDGHRYQLAAVVATVEEGGLSAASRRLQISQPALSQTVNNLERELVELAVRLLVRTSTGVQPTEAGGTASSSGFADRAVAARRSSALG
jgi:hypothetical protein